MSSRSPLVLPAIIGALLLALIAGVFVVMRGSPTPDATPETATPSPSLSPSTPPEPVEPDKEAVLLVTDGWSLSIAGSAEATVTDVLGDRATVTFTPVDEQSLADVLDRAPSALVPLLGRMFPMTDDISCTREGCAVDGAPVSLEVLADASAVPELGPSYAGWQVPAVVYVAETSVAPDATFEVSIAGSQPVRLTAPVSNPDEFGSQPDVDLDALANDPFFGFAAAVYPVSTAFARTFVPNPVWVGDEFLPRFLRPDNAVAPSLDVLSEIAAEPVPFVNGLNFPEPAVADLDGPALTWLSSPSSGCGPGVICTPQPVDYEIQPGSFAIEVEKVCSSGGDAGVIVRDAVIDVNYPHPTHQTGAWYEASASVRPLSDNPDAVAYWRGTPALADGPVTLRVTTAAFYTGSIPEAPELYRFVGRSAMPGFDPNATEPLAAWLERNFTAERDQLICTGSS